MHRLARRQGSGLLIALAVCGGLWGCPGPAVVVAQTTESLDEQLLRSLEQPGKSERDTLLSRLLKNAEVAQQRLTDQQLDQQTRELQTQILIDFDTLLKQLDTTPPDSGSSGGSAAGAGSSSSGSASSESSGGRRAQRRRTPTRVLETLPPRRSTLIHRPRPLSRPSSPGPVC